jgi:hypothetical protein
MGQFCSQGLAVARNQWLCSKADAVTESFAPCRQICTAVLQARWGEVRGLRWDWKRLLPAQVLIVTPPLPGHDDQAKTVDLFRLPYRLL